MERARRAWWAVLRFWARAPKTTMKEFAASEGVIFHALVYRVYQREKLDREVARRKKEAAPAMRLVPVTVPGGDRQQPTSPLVRAESGSVEVFPWLEAETAAGVRLRFGVGTDEDYVAGLLLRLARGAAVHRGGGAGC